MAYQRETCRNTMKAKSRSSTTQILLYLSRKARTRLINQLPAIKRFWRERICCNRSALFLGKFPRRNCSQSNTSSGRRKNYSNWTHQARGSFHLIKFVSVRDNLRLIGRTKIFWHRPLPWDSRNYLRLLFSTSLSSRVSCNESLWCSYESVHSG